MAMGLCQNGCLDAQGRVAEERVPEWQMQQETLKTACRGVRERHAAESDHGTAATAHGVAATDDGAATATLGTAERLHRFVVAGRRPHTKRNAGSRQRGRQQWEMNGLRTGDRSCNER